MFNKKKEEISEIRKLVSSQKTRDRFILDDENAIILIDNDDQSTHKDYYIMIHQRLTNGKLVEMNRWYIRSYYYGPIQKASVIKDLNLFLVQNMGGSFSSLYDYKNANFVVPRNIWDIIESGYNDEYLKKYNGFLATFEISSDYEEGDVFSYTNPITNAKITKSFMVKDGSYYAILNIDGTIRGNKIFKGSSFSEITEIIDLSKYDSLSAFKEERKQLCNDKKQEKRKEYHQMIELRNDGSISPYLDSEVAKVLNLKK
ncbi:MAG: hypothetical protein E7172_05585 [Firmicutes bacterium]|nr:hypothetical protein [Bacillota bacterium]